MRKKQVSLILFITADIDNGNNHSISTADIREAVLNESIFDFIYTKIDSPYPLKKDLFSKDEIVHLVGHWKILFLSSDFEKNYRIGKNPLCILLALTALSIQ
jgi:hypothetical protein